ncbi:MAG: hypothetical protein AAF517_19545, partial [Planctomycetota bacterium]
FWEKKQCSRVELRGSANDEGDWEICSEDDDVLEKMVYVLTNPVAAGLVKRGVEWPGVRLGPLPSGGKRLQVERPKFYFRTTQKIVELKIERPQVYTERSDREFGALLAERVRAKEDEIRATFRATGRTFLGADAVKRQRPTGAPKSEEPKGGLTQRFTGNDRWAVLEKVRRDREWLKAYVAARDAWLTDKCVEFPAGTYWLKIHAGVGCGDVWRPPDAPG